MKLGPVLTKHVIPIAMGVAMLLVFLLHAVWHSYAQGLPLNAQGDKKRHIVPNFNLISATAIQTFCRNMHHLQ